MAGYLELSFELGSLEPDAAEEACFAAGALAEMVIEGIKTNIPLHQEIFNHAAFRSGGQDIHYLERRLGLR